MTFVNCHFCKRWAYWRHPSTDYQVCSGCKTLVLEEKWDDLASQWLHWYPEEWVPDVSAYTQVAFERADFSEEWLETYICEGCDGSVCDTSHTWGRLLVKPGVYANNPKPTANEIS